MLASVSSVPNRVLALSGPVSEQAAFFAQDATDVAAVVDALANHIDKSPQHHWAVLVDTCVGPLAAAPGLDLRQAVNCYAQTDALAGLADIAPLLVPLAPTGAGRSLFESLLKQASGLPMLSVVASRIGLNELAQRWAPLHLVGTGDGERLLLRAADTRVLELMPQHLSSAQWHAWTEPLAHWFTIDRMGSLAACPSPAEPPQTPPASIDLSDAQFAAFMDAAEPDMVYARLAASEPGRVPGRLRPSEALHNMRIACDFCRKHRISHFDDICEIAIRAFLTEGRCLKDSALLEILINRSWRAGHLASTLAD